MELFRSFTTLKISKIDKNGIDAVLEVPSHIFFAVKLNLNCRCVFSILNLISRHVNFWDFLALFETVVL